MRLKIFIFFLFISTLTNAQGEMSGLFVGERFNLYNGAIHQQLWVIPDFIIAQRNAFNISIDDLALVNEAKIEMLPVVYLLHEENFWSVETVKRIDLKNNQSLIRLSDSENLFQYLIKNKVNPKFEFYRDSKFNEPLFADEIPEEKGVKPTELMIRETWSYNKISNQLEKFVLGIGFKFLNIAGQESDLWVYFPKIKGQIKYEFENSTFIDCISNNKYHTAALETRTNTFYAEPQSVFCALDQLIIINQLEQELYFQWGYKAEGSVKSTVVKKMQLWNGLSYQGEFLNGFKNGVHQIKKGDSLVLEFQIKDKKLDGPLKKYEQGRLLAHFNMKNGLREDTATIYHPNGSLFQKLVFADGYYQGDQEVFYQNGSKMLKYGFSEKMLNGRFSYFDSIGNVLYEGNMSRGLKVGEWNYRVRLPDYLQTIMKGNTGFFDQNFKCSPKWNSKILLRPYLDIKVDYEYFRSEDCLNSICLKLNYR